MSKQAVNTFKLGLVMDLNPLANDNKSLTNALNATFITLNGNELMLLNDMGNGRINRVRLDDGYIPVGIKEYGGIIYVASYNPKTGKGLIGSFPYPKLEWEGNNFTKLNSTVLNQLYGNVSIKAKSLEDSSCILDFYEIKDDTVKLPLLVDSTGELLKIRSGDSFSILFDKNTIQFLNSSTVSVKLIVKTSSNYYTISDNKTDIINGKTFVYGGSYSGYVYLQIDLLIYNNFEVDYILNNQGATIYPRAYRDDSDPSSKAVVLKDPEKKEDPNKNTTNLNCSLENSDDFINVYLDGIYYIYPITADGGYIENLKRKINIYSNFECNSNVAQFKYYLEGSTLRVLFEYLTRNDNYNSSGNITYTYRLYPIKVISESIKTIDDLNNLYKTKNYITEVQKNGYTTKSGIRYFEVNLILNDIYLLTVSCNENVLFTRFVYGTSRYNKFYNTCDDYNSISREDESIDYTLSSNIFLPRLLNMLNYHRLVNGNWSPVDLVVRYSEEPITTEDPNYPKAFKTTFDIILEKTTDMYIECVPEDTYSYILDNESFSVPIQNISITINNWLDNPLKYSNNTLFTSEPGNTVKQPSIVDDSLSFVFHRYISSESDDGIILLDRLVKTMAPVFNSKNIDDLLIGYSYTNNYIDVVIASKKFLSNICNRVLNPLIEENISNISKNDIGTHSYLLAEESLTGENGSVKLSNLLAALLGHSQETSNGISIFDIFAGGNSTDESGNESKFRDAADMASLRIRRTLNSDENAGIDAPQNDKKEINADDDWMIATCLNIKGKPMPITLASRCINSVFSNGFFVGEYTDKLGELVLVSSTNESNKPLIDSSHLKDYTYINVGKKLLCFLSLIFTLLDLLKNIYLVGPSLNVLNYNVQDTSYFEYSCSINNSNNTFTKGLDTILNSLSEKLKSFNFCNDNCYPVNYIGSVKGKVLTSLYNYGHLVNLDSSLFNHVLSQYENAYDNDEPLDESNGRTDEEIYYLNADAKSLSKNNNFSTETTELWENSGIYFNPEYHCFEYDLGKFDFSKNTKQSKVSNPYDCMFDWTGRVWKFSPIVNNFITVFKALREYSNILSKLTNNYILLNRITTDVKTKWSTHDNTNGPGLVYIDFGLRGLCKTKNSKYTLENLNDTSYRLRAERIADIINEYEFNRLKEEGFYEILT